MQTNGTLLTPRWCRLLGELDIQIGVSLDGPQMINDRHRRDHEGNGSYEAVRTGIDNAKRCGLSFGILTVIDPSTDPGAVCDHLVELGPRAVDLLLPEATLDDPPAALRGMKNHQPRQPVYGDWLLRFFERWSAHEEPPFRVRRFDQIISTVLGQASHPGIRWRPTAMKSS